MAIVKMRDLLRTPRPVFEELERTGEPILLTRDGEPVAALYPVDPQQSEEAALAALPEFVDSRSRARGARREGRTVSAAELLEDFGSRHGGVPPATGEPGADVEPAPEETPAPVASVEEGLLRSLSLLFGAAVSGELMGELQGRIATASEPVLSAAPPEVRGSGEASSDFAKRVHELNGELFSGLLQKNLRRTTAEAIAIAVSGRPAPPEVVFGRSLLVETLDAVTDEVKRFNSVLLEEPRSGPGLTLAFYEACVRAVSAIETVDTAAEPAPAVAAVQVGLR